MSAPAGWVLVADRLAPLTAWDLAGRLERAGMVARYVRGGGVAIRSADPIIVRLAVAIGREVAR